MRKLILFLSISIALAAGARSIKGILTGNGEPLTGGVLSWLPSSGLGFTVKNADGSFELTVPSNAKALVANYIGFIPDTVPVNADTEFFNIDLRSHSLDEVTVSARARGVRKVSGAENAVLINQNELFKAACCNLAESFTTNPSVDVAYSDAATGARQIKLLGLSGAYVRMTSENVPEFRGAASPYALGYVPGPWMQSIQVSKGASSVKNGFESITGQINIEYLKPQLDPEYNFNLYADSKMKVEENFTGNIHISDKTSTMLLLHHEDRYVNHDENHDGFEDSPRLRQFNIMNRWSYFSDRYIMQSAIHFINEKRKSGPDDKHGAHITNPGMYVNDITTNRIDFWTKNAFVIDRDKNSSIAFIGNIVNHLSDAIMTLQRRLDTRQFTAYGQLLFESDFTENHFLSLGANYTYDGFRFPITPVASIHNSSENIWGGYGEYTFTSSDKKIIAMLGLRYDYSSLYKGIFTPRAHLKYAPSEHFSVRASAGKGYRKVIPAAEYSYLFSTSLPIIISPDLPLEEGWNYGLSASTNFTIGSRNFSATAEYYYTHFIKQVQLDRESNPGEIILHPLDGKSFSHTFQIEINGEIYDGLTFTAAYRLTNVRETYSGKLMRKPLTSPYKAMLSLSYLTPLELWQFDATMQLNGGGILPAAPVNPVTGVAAWGNSYPTFTQLSAQVMRHFRHISIYIGGENLTDKKQGNPITYIPETGFYDPTVVWGPVHGAMIYAGFRLKF